MTMKMLATVAMGVMMAVVMTVSVAAAADINCKTLCEKAQKCPDADKQSTVTECIKGCTAMKENLRKDLSAALLTCAEANMCKTVEASDECMKKAMAANMGKEAAPVKGAEKLVSAYCDKMMQCVGQAGTVPAEQVATMKAQCNQNMAMSGLDKMLSEKGVKRFTECMTKSTCDKLDACMAEVFGATPEK